MTSEHQFIFSAAGVAKSLYANQIFSYFRNSSVFAMQFCPDTTPDDLFGAYDINKFKKGEVLVTEMTDPDWVPVMKRWQRS